MGDKVYSYFNLNKGKTHYELIKNTKESLIFVNSLAKPMSFWDYEVDYLKDKDYSLLRFNYYGRGESEKLKLGYESKLFLGQLKGVLNSSYIDKNKVFVANGYGSIVASKHIINTREEVKKLVLINPYLGIGDDLSYKLCKVPLLSKLFFKLTVKKGLINKEKKSLLEEKLDSFLEEVNKDSYADSYISMIKNDLFINHSETYEALGKLNMDILVIYTLEDRKNISNNLSEMCKLLPKARISFIRDWGKEEGRKEVLKKVEEFITA